MCERLSRFRWNKERLWVIFFSFIIVSPAILPGMTYGYSAIALPELHLNLEGASWFGCFSNIGCFIGALLCGFVVDKYGRKPCLVISIIPSIIGWFSLTLPYTPSRGNLGRFLTGLTTGSTLYVSSVYLAECVFRHRLWLRTSFATWASVATTFGICLVYILGSFLEYDQVASVGVTLSIIFEILILIFVPESPVWLYQRGRIGDAEWYTKYFRLQVPVNELPRSVHKATHRRGSSFLLTISRRDVYKPLLITTTLLTFANLSGGMILVTYMVNVLKTPTISFAESYHLAVISGFLQLVISSSITFILPYSGNRRLAIMSGLGLIVGMTLIGATAILEIERYQNVVDVGHTAAVWFCIGMYSFGYVIIPNALLGELFPSDVTGFASFPTLISFIINCAATKLHLYLVSHYAGMAYFVYALINVAGVFNVYILMPETVGKTLEEIRMDFL